MSIEEAIFSTRTIRYMANMLLVVLIVFTLTLYHKHINYDWLISLPVVIAIYIATLALHSILQTLSNSRRKSTTVAHDKICEPDNTYTTDSHSYQPQADSHSNTIFHIMTKCTNNDFEHGKNPISFSCFIENDPGGFSLKLFDFLLASGCKVNMESLISLIKSDRWDDVKRILSKYQANLELDIGSYLRSLRTPRFLSGFGSVHSSHWGKDQELKIFKELQEIGLDLNETLCPDVLLDIWPATLQFILSHCDKISEECEDFIFGIYHYIVDNHLLEKREILFQFCKEKDICCKGIIRGFTSVMTNGNLPFEHLQLYVKYFDFTLAELKAYRKNYLTGIIFDELFNTNKSNRRTKSAVQRIQFKIEFLLDIGENIDVTDGITGQTILMILCSDNVDNHLIQLVLERGANVNTFDKNGITPLMYLVMGSNGKLAENCLSNFKCLLENNQTINSQDEDGETVLDKIFKEEVFGTWLHRAGEKFISDVMKLLVRAGAKTNKTDLTSLQYSIENLGLGRGVLQK